MVSLAAVAAIAPEDTAKPGCGRSLQSLVDSAAPGTVLDVPACAYREQVTVDKQVTLDAPPEQRSVATTCGRDGRGAVATG